jgi:hypothetical protein
MQWFFLGLLVGWVPCVIAMAIVMWRAPSVDLREDAETPKPQSPSDLRCLQQPDAGPRRGAGYPSPPPTGAASNLSEGT